MPENNAKSDASVWPLFLAASALALARIEARLAADRLPPLAWYDVLWALERAPEQRLRMSDLALRLVIAPYNLTRLVDRLEKKRLVRRERTEADGRGAFAVLTERGAAQRAAMWPVYRAAIAEHFDRHLDAAEAQTLERVLRRVRDLARGDA